MKPRKEPCWTKLVLDTLRGCDDFLNYAMLRKVTGASATQVSAACIHLRKRRAVDCVVEIDGVSWWFALPETSDNRSRILQERTQEVNPRKRRKKCTSCSCDTK